MVLGFLEAKFRDSSFKGYPIASIAHYGPDERIVSKIVVTVTLNPGDEACAVKKWTGTGVLQDKKVQQEIKLFLKRYGAKTVYTSEQNLGCPHEEGIDYPQGKPCPYCQYWRQKQLQGL